MQSKKKAKYLPWGTVVLCKAPNWNAWGYEVGMWDGKRFNDKDYDMRFDDYVTHFERIQEPEGTI